MRALGCLLLMLAAAVSATAAEVAVPEPVLPPGYEPELSKDEQGLWFEMQEWERRLGQSPLLVRDDDINGHIRSIACRVAAAYCDDVRIYVIRNPGFNASMAPNGMMQVWTGLLTRAHSDDEVATVLGHEIAHFTRAHSINQWRKVKREMTAGAFLSLGLGAVTGIYGPVGESLALMSVLAYSREQEEEADLLGAKIMADAGFDPHASYRVWDMLIREEQRAVAKGDDPSAIMRTHPESEARAASLREWTVATYGPAPEEIVDKDYVAFLDRHYVLLMDDQLDTNRYGRMEHLLEQHTEMGVEPALVHFFYGEMFRQRAGDGDGELARNAYRMAIATGTPPADAYRNLGYLLLKEGDRAGANDNFRQYLEARPDADDRAMIEFYLTDEAPP